MTETACSLFSWEHIYNNMCSTSYICEDIIFKFQCIEITIVKKTHFDFSLKYLCSSKGFPGGWVVKNLPDNAEDMGSIPGSGRSSGGGNGNPLQYSCLGNPMDRGALWATVHGVAESDTTKRLHFHFHYILISIGRQVCRQVDR